MKKTKEKWIGYLLFLSIFFTLFITIKNNITLNKQIKEITRIDSQCKENRISKDMIKYIKALEVKQGILQKIVKQQEEKLSTLIVETMSLPEILQNKKQPSEEPFQEDTEEEHINSTINNLEEYWNDDAIDAQSMVTEIKLLENFTQLEGIDVIHASCKSQICRLEFQQTAQAILAGNMSFYNIIEAADVFTRSYPNPDGSQRVVMYLSQEQTPFPEELLE